MLKGNASPSEKMKNASLWNVITSAKARTRRRCCSSPSKESGLPDHVRMYLEQSTDRLMGRMRNIIKKALQSTQPATEPTMSTGLGETPATLMTPSQRKSEAVKMKLDNELFASSLDSSKEENGRQEEKKRKIDRTKEAQLAHQKMCKKAMDTMNNVNDLLAKVNTYLDKSKK